MPSITGITNPYYIRNLVHKNLLSGESSVRSTPFEQLLIHSIAIASIYVSNNEKFQETSLFWNASPLTISVSSSIKHCIQHMLNRSERQHTFHRFASWTTSTAEDNLCPWRLKIKWQSFNYFSVIVIYWQSWQCESFCLKPHKKIPTRYWVMPAESQTGNFSEMKNLCYYK